MTIRLAVSGSNLSGDVPFSAALAGERGVFARSSPVGERGDLASLCRSLCAEAGVTAADVEEVLVDVGPGSYTGLRVAVTFVRFLQAFAGVSVRAVDSLAWLCHSACRGEHSGVVRGLLDARRGRFCTAAYDCGGEGGRLVVRQASVALPVDDALASVTAGEIVALSAALAERIGDDLQARGAELRVVRRLVARSLFEPGIPWIAACTDDLEPRYLMASYAES